METTIDVLDKRSTEFKYLCQVFNFINFVANEDIKEIFTTDNWCGIDVNLVIENVFNIFKICKVFKERTTISQMCPKMNYNITNINEFLRLNEGQNIYFTTDVHGDLVCLLYSLLESGVVKYADGPDVIYFDMQNGRIINNIDYYSSLITNLIPIPNLIINDEFKGKFIVDGDLIYRGAQSDSCFCLMYYLLNQKNARDKIEYLVGNHEDTILNDEERGHYSDTPNLSVRDNVNFECFKRLLLNLVSEDKMKFCCYANDVMFSHTIFEKRYILKLLNDFDSQCFIDLKEKIINKIPLQKDDLMIISYILNEHFKFRCLEKDELYQNQVISKAMDECDDSYSVEDVIEKMDEFKLSNIEKIKYKDDVENNTYKDGIMLESNKKGDVIGGLLWSRNFKHDEQIVGLKQVIGHTIVNNPVFFGNNNSILRADVAQSIGTNGNLSHPMLLSFQNGTYNVKRTKIYPGNILGAYDYINNVEKEQLCDSLITVFDEIDSDQLDRF